MKEGLRSGSLAAQLERGNGPSSRVIVRRRGNEVINNGGLESEEKGLNSNDQRCPLLISSDLEANGESKETAIVPLPKESVKVECECEEVGKASELGRRGRKRGRKSKSECGEGGIGDCKKVKESLECKVEVVGRVLRSKTVAMQAIQMEKNGSGKEVDLEQKEDESDGGSRKKLKGKQGRPVQVERKRGRPRKDQGKNVVLERVLDEKEEASGSEKVKRKRGRPPKVLGKNVVLERVKNKNASGSKRNTRASKLEGIVQRNGPNSHIGTESSRFSLTEKSKSHELGIQEHETSSGVKGKGVGAFGFRKGKRGGRKAKHKKGKSKDGRAAEKKLVREQIIDMLMRAGWTIDYRPRRDKEYNDAVYTSPTGRGYWSVTLAYNVLKSHYEDGHCEPGFTFTPIPDGVLTKLKRNASKGKKRRLKLEQEYDSGGNINISQEPQITKNSKYKTICSLARHSKEGLTTDTDGYVPYSGKRTLLSWMVDLGTVPLNAKCQLDSWNKQEESERSGFHLVDVGADDPNDDTCGICGDGGDLICCDGCPSTFHQSCLDIQKFPSGDWHCIYCSCKFCGMFSGNTDQMNYNLDVNDSALLTCQLCEQKYHHMCTQGEDSILDDSSSPSFCGKTCREVSFYCCLQFAAAVFCYVVFGISDSSVLMGWPIQPNLF
ncbi:Increased DNA methylation 1 [Vitis vinifera]|uniref:Increased DNA methylation 1 n=1 Tax=Vitis vinifera TaxID=29760 RepID=A0A438F433_VITVI|nr:Increased DNA methylation 1 [Vitis vinifera]